MPEALKYSRVRGELRGILLTACLVAITTVAIFLIVWNIGLTRGTVAYLIPVLIAAIRWGLVSALFAAACGVVASAYFFCAALQLSHHRPARGYQPRSLYFRRHCRQSVGGAAETAAGNFRASAKSTCATSTPSPAGWRWRSMCPTFNLAIEITSPPSCSVRSFCFRAHATRPIPMHGAWASACHARCSMKRRISALPV